MNGQALILIVDDEPDILAMVSEILREEGYGVEVATDGREALQRLTTRNPDLILLDLMMPRMDGYTFHHTLEQRQGSKPPVVVVSADRNVAQKAAALGADGYLTKPFDLNDLLDTIEQHIQPSQQSA